VRLLPGGWDDRMLTQRGSLDGLSITSPVMVYFPMSPEIVIYESDVLRDPQVLKSWLAYYGVRPELLARLSPNESVSPSGARSIRDFTGTYHGITYRVHGPLGPRNDVYASIPAPGWYREIWMEFQGRYSSSAR
jgi:hypothetical protein